MDFLNLGVGRVNGLQVASITASGRFCSLLRLSGSSARENSLDASSVGLVSRVLLRLGLVDLSAIGVGLVVMGLVSRSTIVMGLVSMSLISLGSISSVGSISESSGSIPLGVSVVALRSISSILRWRRHGTILVRLRSVLWRGRRRDSSILALVGSVLRRRWGRHRVILRLRSILMRRMRGRVGSIFMMMWGVVGVVDGVVSTSEASSSSRSLRGVASNFGAIGLVICSVLGPVEPAVIFRLTWLGVVSREIPLVIVGTVASVRVVSERSLVLDVLSNALEWSVGH